MNKSIYVTLIEESALMIHPTAFYRVHFCYEALLDFPASFVLLFFFFPIWQTSKCDSLAHELNMSAITLLFVHGMYGGKMR